MRLSISNPARVCNLFGMARGKTEKGRKEGREGEMEEGRKEGIQGFTAHMSKASK